MSKLWRHQEMVDGMIVSKFLAVHNDTFGRAFKSKDDIMSYFKNTKYKCEVYLISTDSDENINVFYLKVYSDTGFVNFYDELEKISSDFSNLSDVFYYDVIPCDLNIKINR